MFKKIISLIEKLDFTQTCVGICKKDQKRYYEATYYGEDITKEEFFSKCNVDKNVLLDMKKYPNDYQYGRSEDGRIYYFQHSGIEHFYE